VGVEDPSKFDPQKWFKKSRLIMYTVLLLLSSVGNQVYFKQMTSAMPNYGWYLTQLSTVLYLPIFAALSGTALLGPSRDLLKKFAFMGLFDGLAGTLIVLGGVHTTGTTQVLLGQGVIPITMFLSMMLIGKRYHLLQHAGALTIVLGIVLAKVGMASDHESDSGEGSDDHPFFNLIFFLSMVPTALSSVFKEVAFKGFDGDLDVNVLQFWVALYQFVVNFLAMPIYAMSFLGPQQVPLQEMPDLSIGGSRCLFLLEDQIKRDCGMPGQRPCDHCESAWAPVMTYLVFNLLFNICTMLVIKHGSAALSFLVATLRMPLSSIAFSSTLIMGAQAVKPTFGDLLSLCVIICGLVAYRYGGRFLKRQLRRENASMIMSPTDDISSPSAWQSPSQSPGEDGQERKESHRWRFAPLFVMNPGAQPVLLYVRETKPMPRSAERVRSDLIRRLGAASPLQSPKLRHLSPPSSPASRTGDMMSDQHSNASFHSPGPTRLGEHDAPEGAPEELAEGQAGRINGSGSGEGVNFDLSGLPPN